MKHDEDSNPEMTRFRDEGPTGGVPGFEREDLKTRVPWQATLTFIYYSKYLLQRNERTQPEIIGNQRSREISNAASPALIEPKWWLRTPGKA